MAFRLKYAAVQKSGLLQRRMPVRDWEEEQLASHLRKGIPGDADGYTEYRKRHTVSFLFSPRDRFRSISALLAGFDEGSNRVMKDADDIGQGTFTYFFKHSIHTHFPPAWNLNPITHQTVPATSHWSRIGDFSAGDIKLVWELNRFAFAYLLVRAYWRTGDEKYPELFWQIVEDWKFHNQPNRGANWKCGQEIAFRVMAWIFGLYGFLASQSTTPERVALLSQLVAISGERIEGNIEYALNQRNNHGISEAMGLWTIGVLFPEFEKAERWCEKGRCHLEEQGRSLIYDDGSFSQHSVNYHRLMLHDYLWAFRLGDLNEKFLSEDLKSRVRKAGEFLYQLQEEKTGQVLYYGQNDGALILPLDNCNYLDFRPVVQASHYYFTGSRLFPAGPWDEDLFWFFGPDALTSSVHEIQRNDLKAEQGGYYTLRTDSGFAFVRCATFKDRPSQADMLHVDIWWRGQNIAIDAGTYSYNAPEPWNNALAHTAYHNTVSVDGKDQMDQVSKFLWLPWIKSKVTCIKRSVKGYLAYWEGEHDGYRRLHPPIGHRRAILQMGPDSWLVLDSLASAVSHTHRLHWLFPDLGYEWDETSGRLSLETVAGVYHVKAATESESADYSLVRADQSSPRGWRSPYYQYKEPALSLALATHADHARFWTLFGPGACSIKLSRSQAIIESGDWQSVMTLQRGEGDHRPMVRDIVLMGKYEDRLELN